jgi:hypothetical protein
VSGLLDAADVDGVVGLAFVEGWPYAALLEPDRIADRFDALMEGSASVPDATPCTGADSPRSLGS